jgi:3-hydroxybutyryl-CoA dehydrogenase
MKKVLVIGDADRVNEFKRLNLQHAEVTYHEYPTLEGMDWNFDMDSDEDDEEEGEDEDGRPFLSPEDEDEDDDLIFSNGEHDDEETMLFEEAFEEDPEGSEGPETEGYDIIFDLNMDEQVDALINYYYNEGQVVIGCAVKKSLSEMASGLAEMECKVFGMNAFPTFIDRPRLEMSMMDRADHMILEATMKTLGLEYELVEDQVGMVAPRVISMIINEAAFVVGEGTASVEAVDQAMKLGTNYPKGPFEWCDQIGVWNVVDVIEALYVVFGDGKYKLAPALRRQRDLDLVFYPKA